MKSKKSNGKDGLKEAKGKNMGLQLKEGEENILSRQLRNCLLVTKEYGSKYYFEKPQLLVWWQSSVEPYK